MTKEQNIKIILNSNLWPLQPYLPMRINTNKMGFMYESDIRKEIWIVYTISINDLDRYLDPDKTPKIEFNNLFDLLEAGWRVD